MGPKSDDRCSYKRKGKETGDTEDREDSRPWDNRGRDWSDVQPQPKGCPEPLEAGRGQRDCPFKLWRQRGPAVTWFQTLASRTVREYILCCCKPPSLW